MDIMSVLIVILIATVFLAKGYNIYNTIKKKGIKGLLSQKLIMLAVVAVLFGIFTLIKPDLEIKNPKHIIGGYISQMMG